MTEEEKEGEFQLHDNENNRNDDVNNETNVEIVCKIPPDNNGGGGDNNNNNNNEDIGMIDDTNNENNNNNNNDDTAGMEMVAAASDNVVATTAPAAWWYESPMQIIAMLSNFSTSYNVVNISMALLLLEEIIPNGTKNVENVALISSSLLLGMILGQLGGGALGDSKCIGSRLGALRIVMMLQIVASIGSGLTWNNPNHPEDFFLELAIWRFLLGIGAGGVYPLAAVLSAEQTQIHTQMQTQTPTPPQTPTPTPTQTQTQTNELQTSTPTEETSSSVLLSSPPRRNEQIHSVVLTFSMQGIGFLAAPLITLPLLYIMPHNLNFIWRFVLGIGSLPGIILMILQWYVYQRNNPHHHHHHHHHHGHDQILLSTSDDPTIHPQDTSIVTSEQPQHAQPQLQPQPPQHYAQTQTTIQYSNLGQQEQQENNNHHHNHTSDCNDYDHHYPDDDDDDDNDNRSLWNKICDEPYLFTKLLGTAGTWFLFDVLFYGNTLFQPIVVGAVFGNDNDNHHNSSSNGSTSSIVDSRILLAFNNTSSTSTSTSTTMMETAIAETVVSNAMSFTSLQKDILGSILLTSIALPGYFISNCTMGKYQSPQYVMLQGFAMMSLLFFCIGYNWDYLRSSGEPMILVLLYGGTFLFSNYGPNTSTFLLPSITFSSHVRTTLNGVSAASGKLGAFIGASMFEPLSDTYGNANVMYMCSGIAFLSWLLTYQAFYNTTTMTTTTHHRSGSSSRGSSNTIV